MGAGGVSEGGGGKEWGEWGREGDGKEGDVPFAAEAECDLLEGFFLLLAF